MERHQQTYQRHTRCATVYPLHKLAKNSRKATTLCEFIIHQLYIINTMWNLFGGASGKPAPPQAQQRSGVQRPPGPMPQQQQQQQQQQQIRPSMPAPVNRPQVDSVPPGGFFNLSVPGSASTPTIAPSLSGSDGGSLFGSLSLKPVGPPMQDPGGQSGMFG